MKEFNWATLVNTFDIVVKQCNDEKDADNEDGDKHKVKYFSNLSIPKYLEQAKKLAAKEYDSAYLIGTRNRSEKIYRAPRATGIITCDTDGQVYILAGSLIRNIEDYRDAIKLCSNKENAEKFSIDEIELRKKIETEAIKIQLCGMEYTMVLKDTPVKSINEAARIIMLSGNDARRRVDVDLRPYKCGASKFLLQAQLLNGFNLNIDGKCVGEINGSYIVTLDTHETKPIDSFLEYRDKISCGIFAFDSIYKEIN